MIRLIFLVTCLVLLASPQMPSTTDWRGLSPLKSTRQDVERTLGPPHRKTDNQVMTYYFSDVTVFFDFSTNPKCEQKLPYTSWNVTADTVTSIDVVLKHQPLMSETGIDLTKLKKVKGDHDVVGHYHYLNPDDGFSVEVNNDYLTGYHYWPGSNQQNLRCERRRQPDIGRVREPTPH